MVRTCEYVLAVGFQACYLRMLGGLDAHYQYSRMIMSDEIVFTLRLTSDDWDPGLHAWRCPALDIPSAFIAQARDAKGKPIQLELLKIEKSPARVTWIGAGQPAQISVVVGLREELSLTSKEQFWRRLAVVIPIITAIIGAGATYLSKPGPGPAPSLMPHMFRLSVFPNDLESSGLPPAKITVNNREVRQPIEYRVASDVTDVTAIVDVSKAVEFAKKLGDAYKDQKNTAAFSISGVNDVLNELSGLSSQLNDLATGVGGPICPGGAAGQPSPVAGRLRAQATAVSDKLKSISSALNRTLSIDVAVPK